MNRSILGVFFLLLFMLVFLVSCQEKEQSINVSHENNKFSGFEFIDQNIFDGNRTTCHTIYGLTKTGFLFSGNICNTNDTINIKTFSLSDNATESDYKISYGEYGEILYCDQYNKNVYFIFKKNDVYSLKQFDSFGKLINEINLDYYPTDFNVNNLIYTIYSDVDNIYVSCYNHKLELVSSDIVKYESEYGLFPKKIAVSDNGDVFSLLYNKIIGEYILTSVDGHKCIKINDLSNIDAMFFNKSSNIVLCGKENEVCLVDEINTDGEIINLYEIENCDIIHDVSDSGVIYSNDKGVFCYENNSEKMIISSENYVDNYISYIKSESDEISIFLSEQIESQYSALIEADFQGNIIKEYPVNNIYDCFLKDSDIYYINGENSRYCLYIISGDEIVETGISYVDINYAEIGVFENGNIAIFTSDRSGNSSLDIYDVNYNKIKNASVEHVDDFIYLNNSLYYKNATNLYEIKNDLSIVESTIDHSILGSNSSLSSGNDEYDLFFSNEEGLFGYNMGTQSYDMLIDYYQISGNNLGKTFLVNENKDILMCNGISIFKATHKTYSNSEKENIVIAVLADKMENCGYINDAAKKFNQSSEEYIINIKVYPDSDEYTSVELLDRDIISGNIPDAICLNNEMNIQTYIKDNMLTDMYTYINNKNDFYSNVLNAFEYNNQLYYMPLTYNYSTIISNSSAPFKNINEYMEYVRNESNYEYISSGYDVKLPFYNFYLSEFISSTNRLPEISQTDLYNLLSFDNLYLNYAGNELEEYPKYFSDGSVPFSFVNVFGDIESFNNEIEIYGCKFNIGYTDSTCGLIDSEIGFSITEQSQNKEIVWSFIEFVMGEIEDNIDEITNAYIKKPFNEKYDAAEISKQTYDLYLKVCESKWRSDFLINNISRMIIEESSKNFRDEITRNDSDMIYNKIKLYIEEIK